MNCDTMHNNNVVSDQSGSADLSTRPSLDTTSPGSHMTCWPHLTLRQLWLCDHHPLQGFCEQSSETADWRCPPSRILLTEGSVSAL